MKLIMAPKNGGYGLDIFPVPAKFVDLPVLKSKKKLCWGRLRYKEHNTLSSSWHVMPKRLAAGNDLGPMRHLRDK